MTDLTKRETAILCTIVLFVFLMGLYPGMFLRKMDASAAGYLKYVQARNAAAAAPVPPNAVRRSRYTRGVETMVVKIPELAFGMIMPELIVTASAVIALLLAAFGRQGDRRSPGGRAWRSSAAVWRCCSPSRSGT